VGVALKDLLLPTAPPGASPALDLLCENWQQAYSDWAPDVGHVAYPPSVGFLSCIPDEGTLAAAVTSAVTLRADARGLAAGATRRVRLYFMSNDPDELPTRDVVINVIGGTPAVFKVDPSGIVRADGPFYGSTFITCSGCADVAEWVPVSEPVDPGTVLELDAAQPGSYRPSQSSCSPLVAGVVSSQPGMVLGGTEPADGKALLALSGIVPVKVTGEGGVIQPGDLLVTSSTPGYAMRWAGGDPCSCALVGKALEPFTDERGSILVLLTAH
jgi:hypothetical protein